MGSHGGLGGPQSHPFVLVPAGWRQPDEEIVGAEHLHAMLRGWLVDLGHTSYAPQPATPAGVPVP